MIPMIVIIVFYIPVLLPFASLLAAMYLAFKLGEHSGKMDLDHRPLFDRAYDRLTNQLLATLPIPF